MCQFLRWSRLTDAPIIRLLLYMVFQCHGQFILNVICFNDFRTNKFEKKVGSMFAYVHSIRTSKNKSYLDEATTKILSTLTPREERVLRMRFGVGMNTDHTLEEVGLQFSVTRERIRQIEAKALRKLKHPSRSKQLKSFLES